MNKRSFVLFFFLAFLIVLPLAARAYILPDTCPQAFRMEGRLADAADVPIYSEPDNKSSVLGRFKKGSVCEITGREGNFYRVEFDGISGYITKGRLNYRGAVRQETIPETNVSALGMDNYAPTVAQAKSLPFNGELLAQEDIDTVFVYIWDERQQKIETSLIIPLKEASDVVPIESMKSALKLQRITAGRKTVVFQGGGKTLGVNVLARSFMTVLGSFKEARHITDQCKVSGYNVSAWREKTVWTPTKSKPSLTVTFPKDGSAALMTLDWWLPPDEIKLEYYDQDGQLFDTQILSTGFYLDTLHITPQMAKVVITPSGQELKLKILRVYDENYPRDVVQEWQSVPDKVDMMVFSAHQDDELLFLGGTVPYACGVGKDVAMVYMTNGGRSRYREAMDGMWTCGLQYHPIFLSWRDQKVKSLKTARNTWYLNNHDPVADLVALIRKYKPDVIVTQDLNGEYGHTQHRLTAILLTEAVELTKDPDAYPESTQEYGVWDVKKLYVHLYEKDQISMDWNQPLDADGIMTPYLLAKEAYDKHRSQQKAYNFDRDGKQYKNWLFGLYYTSVGPDIEKNDFFENIP